MLRPVKCKRCKEEPEVVNNQDYANPSMKYRVECNDLCWIGPPGKTKADAIRSWNDIMQLERKNS